MNIGSREQSALYIIKVDHFSQLRDGLSKYSNKQIPLAERNLGFREKKIQN